MDEAQAALLRGLFSQERIQPYVARCGGDPVAAMRLYWWNIEASAAFHGPLAVLEVVLRNALHTRLAGLTGRNDWWLPGAVRLAGREATKVANVRAEVQRRQRLPQPGDIISELSFGFWAALLRSEYEVPLWRPALRHAFPRYRGSRGPLHQDLHHLCRLRNRIAHHEPIHHRHLAADHRKILLVLDHMSPVAAEVVRANDRVGEVLARRAAVCSGSAVTRF